MISVCGTVRWTSAEVSEDFFPIDSNWGIFYSKNDDNFYTLSGSTRKYFPLRNSWTNFRKDLCCDNTIIGG